MIAGGIFGAALWGIPGAILGMVLGAALERWSKS